MKLKKSFSGWILFTMMLAIVFGMASCEKESELEKQAAIDKALIDQYVIDHQLDGQYTASGTYYEVQEDGNGSFPYSSAIIQVTYKGYFLDGTVFDEGYISAAPLSTLILGWQDGIPRIDVGGKIKLVAPSRLGYGTRELDNIPANSVLVFDITLHDFE